MKYLFLILGCTLAVAACRKQPEKTQASVEKITESVYASGVIKSREQYQAFSQVNGLIREILVREGDLVKKGDPLLIIQDDNSRLDAENARLSADLAEWNARGDRLNELKSAIETARVKMLNDSLLLVRQRGLWDRQIGSRVDFEQRELAYTSSVNNYKAAVYRYHDLQKQLGVAAEQSRRQLAISRNVVQDHVVRSQTDGRVYSLAREEGEFVGTQSPVAVIGKADEFVAELEVDESDIVRIRPGQRVFLTLDSYPGQVFEAEVTGLDPLMKESSRTFTVEAVFTRKPPVLYPNLTAEANIVIQSRENAVTIPRSYLVDDSLVILENREKRRVEIGLKDYLKAEIRGGLDAGETILKPVR
jgi:HlyD family secretion protein